MMRFEQKAPGHNVKVYLSGKLVGHIKPVDGGFKYFPKGSKVGGETFMTIEQVKRSL